jgi:hypothetical protein
MAKKQDTVSTPKSSVSDRSILARVYCTCGAKLIRKVNVLSPIKRGDKTLSDCPKCQNEDGQKKIKLIFLEEYK